jgi:hypothetical protein
LSFRAAPFSALDHQAYGVIKTLDERNYITTWCKPRNLFLSAVSPDVGPAILRSSQTGPQFFAVAMNR